MSPAGDIVLSELQERALAGPGEEPCGDEGTQRRVAEIERPVPERLACASVSFRSGISSYSIRIRINNSSKVGASSILTFSMTKPIMPWAGDSGVSA